MKGSSEGLAPSHPPVADGADLGTKARVGDMVRVVGAALWGMCRAVIRRLGAGPLRPSWGLGLEAVLAAYQGTWSMMPRLGIVRWRNVSETLSPLVTGGLVPRPMERSQERARPFQAHWLEPPEAGSTVLLYLHGGGFNFGSLRTHGALIAALARAAGARALALEYRLAPEHPAPAALEDALAVYQDLLDQGIPAKRIVLAGDSAGGTLVLNTLLALRDAGRPLPAAGVAISPWVDLSCSGSSFIRHARYDFVGEEHCRLAASGYLAGADPRRPDLSPLFADLSGLPPLLIQAGGLETLIDQIRAFCGRAEEADVELRFSVYEEMVHVWHLLRGMIPEAQQAIDEVGAFVREKTSTVSGGQI